MRAVNLIPAEDRRGAGGAAGRSGGAAHGLVGFLAVLVVLAASYALVGRSVTHKRAEVARVEQQATTAEAQAQGLTSYTNFAQMREQRVQTVKSLAASRFDWSHAMHELSRVIPDNVWLTAVTGTVSPGVDVQGAATGTTGALRGAVAAPAIEMLGCSTDQSQVARLMTRLRLIDGVQRVALQSSEKLEQASGGGGSSSGGSADDSDCRHGNARWPQFGIVVFYDTPAAPAAAAPATGTTVPAAQTTTTTTTPGAAK